MAGAQKDDEEAAQKKRWREEAGRRLSPGGRPLDYRGSEGWPTRVISRSLAAGGIGAGVGFLVGAASGHPPLRLGASVGANFLVAASCFCGAQEISRELRASDPEDWINCVLGGLASGALLGHLQGGRGRALPMGLLFAGIGTGAQLGAIQFREYRLHHFLSTLPPESITGDSHVEVTAVEQEKGHEKSSWKVPDWFPIQVLSAEEAAKRALEQEEKRRKTLEKIQIGELPLKEQSP